MTLDQAKYIASIADRLGIKNWDISEDRKSYSPAPYTFTFEGIGNLPHLRRDLPQWMNEGITIDVTSIDGAVIIDYHPPEKR